MPRRPRHAPAAAEVFGLIRAHLRFFNSHREVRSVLIASPAPDEGKTTVARHVAASAAAAGSHVLLIETDKSVLEIGFRVGFGNYSNFNRQFKKIKGFGPRTLRSHFSPDVPLDRSRQLNPPDALDAVRLGT